MLYNLPELLGELLRHKAAALVLMPDSPPLFVAQDKTVTDRSHTPDLLPEECRSLIFSALTEEQQEALAAKKQVECPFAVKGIGRFTIKAKVEGAVVAATIEVAAAK